MRILVPTDFSSCAKKAVEFAISFATQVHGSLVIVHALPEVGPTLGTLPTDEVKSQILESTEAEFEVLKKDLRLEPVKAEYQVVYGSDVSDALVVYTKIHEVDLIIMGSHGTNRLKNVLLGSNAIEVINRLSLPVIIVPESTQVLPVKHLLYASDLRHIMEEAALIAPFANRLQAMVSVLHIPPVEYLQQLDTASLEKKLKQETGHDAFEVVLLQGDVMETIESKATEEKGSLLIMFTHRTRFLEQLFRKSITREIAWHNRVPLFVINTKHHDW